MEIRGGVTDAGQTNKQQTLKIELLSQWMIEAEFRNLQNQTQICVEQIWHDQIKLP